MTEAGKTARKAYEDAKASGESDRKNLKKAVGASLHRTFRRKLDREPMVVPIFVEV